MDLCKRLFVGIAFLLFISMFSCEKKDSSAVTFGKSALTVEIPDELPVIIEQPNSAVYLDNEKIENLTLVAEIGAGYTLSYQWYSMRYHENYFRRNVTEEIIANQIDKLLNSDSKDTLFVRMAGYTGLSCSPYVDQGQMVYICIVTGTSRNKTFLTVSNPAVITIKGHPLKYWYAANKRPFTYKIYGSDSYDRYMELKDTVYGNGYFVAVGDRQRSGSASRPIGTYGVIAYSGDRINWNLVEDHPFNNYGNSIYAVAYGNNRFVAVGTNGKIAYSDDVKTWSPADHVVSGYFANIVYGKGCFVVSSGSGLAYSMDGETWFAVEDFDTKTISCVAFGNDRFFAGSTDGKISYSDDGKTWSTIKDETFDSHTISTICFGNGRFIAFAYSYNDHGPSSYKMGYSDDGKTWHSFTPSSYVEEWNWIVEIIYSEGYFVAIGDDKTAYSEDGIKWENLGESYKRSYHAHGERIRYNAITYGDGYFVAVSTNGIIEHCQWPIKKAFPRVITEQPRWPSSSYNTTKQGYTLDCQAKSTGYGDDSFQWYRNNIDNNTTGTAIEGADHWSYVPDVSKAGTTYYYVKVTTTIPDLFDVNINNRSASVTSNTVAVTVDNPERTAFDEENK